MQIRLNALLLNTSSILKLMEAMFLFRHEEMDGKLDIMLLDAFLETRPLQIP